MFFIFYYIGKFWFLFLNWVNLGICLDFDRFRLWMLIFVWVGYLSYRFGNFLEVFDYYSYCDFDWC